MKSRLPKGMGGGPSNMNALMKQAQKMQEDMTALQEDLEQREFTAAVGGGAVEVVATGKKELKSLTIKPDVVDPEDIEMLQDLVISAVNEVMRQIEEISSAEMEKITGSGGASIPGLF
ncbi:MAG: YbaB/EbfC family nucleoid-associated protein [Oscillospiraceae bacterium]|nr:YbaB/EbfC family nucleoid-associated protein [Oscillospiraceae bacterium]